MLLLFARPAVAITATLARTEASDTLSSSAIAPKAGIGGTLAATEARDSLSAAGRRFWTTVSPTSETWALVSATSETWTKVPATSEAWS